MGDDTESVSFPLSPLPYTDEVIPIANNSALGAIKKPGRPHLSRWFTHVETLPVPRAALDSFSEARRELDKGRKVKRTETVDVVLPNAVPGKVVVRFGESAFRG